MRRTLLGLAAAFLVALVLVQVTGSGGDLDLDSVADDARAVIGDAAEDVASLDDGSGDGGSGDGGSGGSGASPDGSVDVTKVTRQLDGLTVKGKAPQTGYDRDEFDHWTDPDGNGCDARNDMLARDLSDEKVDDDGCTVLSGTYDVEPYTGEKNRAFERGSDDLAVSLDAEHVVALQNAWISGAHDWNDNRREKFANDPANLLMVDPGENRTKGAANAAEWLPPNKAFRCEYVATQIEVKAAYELAITQPEKDAMNRVLESC
ncbi:HNH endonuclease family protein [Isoptericola sp. b515]|uniref:HNH endonuclease family protein n=1 Tax=Isoptericola sp. b515 TaxID=3064652 RepID=UPI002713D6F2|nr:HNH endonuclease family protein [Isoptericola sp. b515]MDO8148245.1 HNH endonuclease family protein [Isoptericola sp. b515]